MLERSESLGRENLTRAIAAARKSMFSLSEGSCPCLSLNRLRSMTSLDRAVILVAQPSAAACGSFLGISGT